MQHRLGRGRPLEHRTDRAEQVRHDVQPRRRAVHPLGHDVDFVSPGQQPLGMLEGPLFRAAAAGVQVIDDQGDFHFFTPAQNVEHAGCAP